MRSNGWSSARCDNGIKTRWSKNVDTTNGYCYWNALKMIVALDPLLQKKYAKGAHSWVDGFDKSVFDYLGGRGCHRDEDVTLSGTVSIEDIETMRTSVDWALERRVIVNGVDVELKVRYDGSHATLDVSFQRNTRKAPKRVAEKKGP